MRLFLAIDLPLSVKKELDKQLLPIRQKYPHFSWVNWENFHITLYFYGEKEDDKKIKEDLKKNCFDQESFYLYSNSVDLFINRKIIIYLNFRREKKLEELVEKINRSLNKNFPKKFIPHLTLARCRIPSKQQYFFLKKTFKKLDINISFPVKKIILFESILGGKKPIYKKRQEIKLL